MAKDEGQLKVDKNLEHIKNRLLVFSGKGGVGKSTVAANLSLAFSNKGLKVGLLDVDIHGPNLAKMLGVENKRLDISARGIRAVAVNDSLKLVSMSFLLQDPNIPVIWRGPMKMKAIQQFLGEVMWGELDWLVIDSPPGTGDEPLSIAQLIPATAAVVVTTPQEMSVMDSRKAIQFGWKLGLKIYGIIENMSGMVCPHCSLKIDLFKEGGGEKAAKELQVPFLGRIPLDPQIVALGDEGKSFIVALPEAPASKAFMKVAEKILEST
jgi:ATP-binding protein involved in chromosome partitioning